MRFIVLFLLLPTYNCIAQQYPFLHYTTENGLPGNMVYCSCVDDKGYLWLSTNKGLARFDGKQFECYTTYDGLPDNEIFDLRLDYDGRMWIGTYNGKIGYYKNGKFYSEKDDSLLKLPFKGSMINEIRIERDSSITFLFYNHRELVNIDKDKRYVYSLGPLSPPYNHKELVYAEKLTRAMYKLYYKDRTLIMDTNMQVHTDVKLVSKIQFNKRGVSLVNDSVYDASGRFIRILKKNFWKRHENEVNDIFIDNGCAFIATQQGVYLNDTVPLMPGMRFSAVRKDREGNYWICSLDDGAYVLNKDFEKVDYHQHICDKDIKYMHADSTGLFMAGQDKCLYKYANNKIRRLFDATPYITRHSLTTRNSYLVDGDVYYAAGFNEDKHIMVTHIHSSPKIFFARTHPSYANDLFLKDGYIYGTSNNEIFRYKRSDLMKNKSFIAPDYIDDAHNGELRYARTQAKDKSIWYSTIDNVYKITDSVSVLQRQFRGIGFRVFCFLGHYLIGYTHANYLLVCSHYDRDDLMIDTVKDEHCIWDKMYLLDATHVLVSTNDMYRVITVYPSSEKPSYTVQALEDPFLPRGADYVCSDGEKCFLLKNGSLTEVLLEDLMKRPDPPQPVFTSLNTSMGTYVPEGTIEVPYDEARYLRLGLGAPVLARQVYYEYSIGCRDDTDNWEPVDGGYLNLYSLGYGDYTVKVRAKTVSSMFSLPRIFYIHVNKPFWATWWFYLLCISAGISAAYMMVAYRIRLALRKKEAAHHQKMQFIRSEYKALNALMNPHFIFNAMNSVQWLVNSDNKQQAGRYIRVFSELIRQNMHNVSQELIPLGKEVAVVSNYLELEKLRFKEFLNYEMIIGEELDVDEILVPPMLIQPIVENAIKHGLFPRQSEDNFLSVRIYEQEACLIINVTDNGVGLRHTSDIADGHAPFSINNIRQRIAQLALMHDMHITLSINELTLPDGAAGGTRVVITICNY